MICNCMTDLVKVHYWKDIPEKLDKEEYLLETATRSLPYPSSLLLSTERASKASCAV